ncbi:MAG: hypothetical protein NUV83_02925 [Candidatus Wolfebacteria bacterium]|nr:hypothetical protein [Candidatus Wolfebacteria bacterium]
MEKIKKILKFLNPQPAIGGLEISDSYLRFVLIKEKKVDFFSLKLPPSIVENGKVKNRDALRLMLLNLHAKITPKKKKKIYAVVSVSDGNIYSSLLSLPAIASSGMDEAAKLNLQMASPVDFESVYSDWQLIGEKELSGGNQLEIFGAFISKTTVNEFESVIEEAGFVTAAVEFPALSLSRVIVKLGEKIAKEKTYLFLRVSGDGLTYGIVKNGNLYFAHFVAWLSAYGTEKKISSDSFKKLIISETRKVLNFHENHIGGQIEKILVITPSMIDDILSALAEGAPNIKSETLSLEQFKELAISWYSVLGVALRGLVPRPQDNIVSLSSDDTDVKFGNYQTIGFIRIWRNISFAILAFVLLVFISLDVFLSSNSNNLQKQLGALSLNPNSQKISELTQQAAAFNEKVELISSAYSNKSYWSPVFDALIEKLGSDITIKRFYLSSAGSPIVITGEAPSEERVSAFGEDLKKDSRFSDVQIPLSSIKEISKNAFIFNLIFKANF